MSLIIDNQYGKDFLLDEIFVKNVELTSYCKSIQYGDVIEDNKFSALIEQSKYVLGSYLKHGEISVKSAAVDFIKPGKSIDKRKSDCDFIGLFSIQSQIGSGDISLKIDHDNNIKYQFRRNTITFFDSSVEYGFDKNESTKDTVFVTLKFNVKGRNK